MFLELLRFCAQILWPPPPDETKKIMTMTMCAHKKIAITNVLEYSSSVANLCALRPFEGHGTRTDLHAFAEADSFPASPPTVACH
jgi:hypothetical protein